MNVASQQQREQQERQRQQQFTGAFRKALEHPSGGVVGLVDDLLKLCQEHGLQFDWQADRCRVRFLADGLEEVIDGPFRKSVFRAILARVAALCNQRRPKSVSPYGGRGEVLVPSDRTLLQVSFANTPDEQWLKMAVALPQDSEPVSELD